MKRTDDGGLTLAFRRFCETPVPIVGPDASDDIGDAKVDMMLDDTYIAGHVDTYLSRGKLDYSTIEIALHPDELLADEARDHPNDEIVHRLIAYRRMMLELAEMLSKQSGVPIERVRRDRLAPQG
jgi:hypothetical protein